MRTFIWRVDGKWFAFGGDPELNRVYSIGRDCQLRIDLNTAAPWTSGGVLHVASPSPSKSAAYQKARRHGRYCGDATQGEADAEHQ